MHDQITWTLAACAQVLRPLIRLALAFGAKHPQLERLLRELLLEEAHRLWRAKGVATPNISQLAMTTGLNRKDVTARLRAGGRAPAAPALPPAALVFTQWLRMVNDDPAQRSLPIAARTGEVSFESLARQATRGNVHHRSVLDDLVRLGMVTERDGQAQLIADGFVPGRDLRSLLSFLGDNTRDHLQVAVSNTLGEGPPKLERTVYSDGLTLEECERIHLLARERWAFEHHGFVQEMTKSVERSGTEGHYRLKIGIYVNFEPLAPAPDATPAATEAPASSRTDPTP